MQVVSKTKYHALTTGTIIVFDVSLILCRGKWIKQQANRICANIQSEFSAFRTQLIFKLNAPFEKA